MIRMAKGHRFSPCHLEYETPRELIPCWRSTIGLQEQTCPVMCKWALRASTTIRSGSCWNSDQMHRVSLATFGNPTPGTARSRESKFPLRIHMEAFVRLIPLASTSIAGCTCVSRPLYSNRRNNTARSCSRVHLCCAIREPLNNTASAGLTGIWTFNRVSSPTTASALNWSFPTWPAAHHAAPELAGLEVMSDPTTTVWSTSCTRGTLAGGWV